MCAPAPRSCCATRAKNGPAGPCKSKKRRPESSATPQLPTVPPLDRGARQAGQLDQRARQLRSAARLCRGSQLEHFVFGAAKTARRPAHVAREAPASVKGLTVSGDGQATQQRLEAD